MTIRSSKTKMCSKIDIFQDEIGNIKKEVDDPPKDRCCLIYILFFLLGLEYILPWNFFITANEYWMYKFRDTQSEIVDPNNRTELQTQFAASLTATIQISNVISLLLTMFYGHKLHIKHRTVGILFIVLLFFVFATGFIYVNTDTWQTDYFAVTMFVVAAISALNSTLGLSTYTIISHFPHEYLAPYINGQGLAGIFTATLQILSLSAGISTLTNAMIYFCMGILVVFATLLLVILTQKNEFYVYHMRKYHEIPEMETKVCKRDFGAILKKIWTSLVVMLSYVIVFNMVSSSNTLVVSEYNGLWSCKYFVPVITFLLRSVTDLIGRWIACSLKYELNEILLSAVSVVRIFIFVPLMLLCNAQPRSNLPVIFPHDYQYILIMILYSLFNGYMVCISSLNINRLVLPEERKNSYQIFTVFSGIIIAAFSFLNFVSIRIL